MAVSLTWGLDKTAGAALSIARDVFLAANHDNVQPLAIASCEKFGNTIAICEETCRKIESLTVRTPEPVMIHFIRAYAGFDAADSATQLGKSQAGLQFLALAAALLSLGDLQCPRSLHKMLESSASDKTLLPTARQLRDLLQSLGPRLTRSGFLDTVAGWYVFLRQSPIMIGEHGRLAPSLSNCPTPEGVGSLVDAFRKLARIGESDITRVSVYLMDCAPWVIAFTKWCLGMPPSIYLDNGKPILEQPGSLVDLIIPGADKKSTNLRVVVHRTVGALSDLVLQNQPSTLWNGMVSVSQYGLWTLSSYELDTGTAKAALMEALPYAIRQIIHSLRFCKKLEDLQLAKELRPLSMIPFPEEHIICRTMSQYLNNPDGMVLRPLEGLRIEDLSDVDLHLKAVRAICTCAKCAIPGPKAYSRCFIDRFYHKVA